MEHAERALQTVERTDALRRRHALIVGKGPEFLRHYRQVFRELGYAILTVASHEAACAFLKSFAFDFVVVEHGGRDAEGRCILDRAREIDQITSVVIVTSCGEASCCLKSLELSADDNYQNPVTIPEVTSLVKGGMDLDS